MFSRAKNVQILFQKLHFNADSAFYIYRIIVYFAIIPTSVGALGAGGREFESRHSDIRKSHDEPFTNAVLSWLFLLHKCSENSDLCLFVLFLSFK